MDRLAGAPALPLPLLLLLLLPIGTAAAAVMPIGAAAVSSGSAAATPCDPDGLAVAHTVVYDTVDERYEVSQVNVSGIHGDCSGGQLRLTLTDQDGASVGSGGPSAVSGASLVVAIDPRPATATVRGQRIVIEGP